MIDVVVTMPGDLALGSDLPSEIATEFGGTGGNVSAWAAAAGGEPVAVGVVGADAWAAAMETHLRALGVTSRLRQHPTLPTGMVVALVHPGGERSMLPDSRANSALSWSDFESVDWSRIGWLYLSAYVLFDSATQELGVRLMQHAKDRGVRVALDPASSAPLRATDQKLLATWLAAADLVLPNEMEFETLEEHLGAGATQRLVPTLLVKRGPAGVDIYQGGEFIRRAPAVPTNLVDSVGAGDAFAGGLLAALAGGVSLDEAVLAATQSAAKAVSKRGAQPATRAL